MENYLTAVGDVLATKRAETQTALLNASANNPDVEAQRKQLRDKINQPYDPTQVDDKGLRARAAQADMAKTYNAFIAPSERLSTFYRAPQNAAVAHDDVPALSLLDNLFLVPRAVASVVPAFGKGTFEIAEGGFRALADVSNKADLSGILDAAQNNEPSALTKAFTGASAWSRRRADYGKKQYEAVRGPEATTWFGKQAQGAGLSLGTMAPGLLATLGTGGAATPLVTAAYLAPGVIIQTGQSTRAALDHGKDGLTALRYGATDGAIEFITEKIPVGKLVGDIAKGTGFGKLFIRQLATEIPGEQVATITQNLNAWATLNPDKPLSAFIAEQPADMRDTLAQTVLAVGGLSGTVRAGQAVARLAQRRADKATRSAQGAQTVEAMTQAAVASRTRTRSPDTFKEAVAGMAADTPAETVFVSAAVFNQTMTEQNINPKAVFEALPSVAAQIEEATATGGDIRIPTAELLTTGVGTQVGDAILSHVRFDPHDMSRAELEVFDQDSEHAATLRAEIDTALGQHEKDTGFQDERNLVRETISGALKDAGHFPNDINTHYVDKLEHFISGIAAKTNITPSESYARYGPKIVAHHMGVSQNVYGQPLTLRAKLNKEIYHDQQDNPEYATRVAQSPVARTGNESDSRRSVGSRDGVKAATRPASVRMAATTRLRTPSGASRHGSPRNERASLESANAVYGETTDRPVYEITDPTAFRDAVLAAKASQGSFGAQVTAYDDYTEQRLFLFDDGASGFALAGDDIISVFSTAGSSKPRAAQRALEVAVAQGGRRLDAFNTFLPKLYADNGFKAVARVAFSREFAPEGWDYAFVAEWFPESNGEPAIYFMVYDPENASPNTDNTVDTYDDGLAAQQAALDADQDALPETIEIDGEQKHTTDSTGKQIAQTQEGIRNFYAWFGKSKVVDAQGRPLVVYHGTNADFDIFEEGKPGHGVSNGEAFYFTDNPEVAATYGTRDRLERQLKALFDVAPAFTPEEQNALDAWKARRSIVEHSAPEGHIILPLYLKIEKAKTLNAKGNSYNDVSGGKSKSLSMSEASSDARAAKKHGLIVKNVVDAGDYHHVDKAYERGGDTTYIVFSPEQIKSAVGNSGAFDPANPNILFQGGQGPFGEILTQFHHDAQGAIEQLTLDRSGEAVAALHHPDIGDIDLVWGKEGTGKSDGYGLAKLLKFHPEVVSDLQNIIASMVVVSRSDNRVQLESKDHQAGVSLQYFGEAKTWLLTAFEKEGSEADPTIDTANTDKTGDSPSFAPQDASITKDIKDFYQNNKQTARGAYDPASRTISLFKNADLSTVIHESGHFFLDTYEVIASDVADRLAKGEAILDGEQSILDDFNETLNWFGVKPNTTVASAGEGQPDPNTPTGDTPLAAWRNMSLDQKRVYHEQFARGFEAYVMEGKAPSEGLRSAFRRFKAWLLNIYKSAVALNVELTAEVRGVMDRMLASDEDIKDAQDARDMQPMFADQLSAGMTSQEWRDYQDELALRGAQATESLTARSIRDMKWLDNAKSKVMRDLQKQAAGKRSVVRQQVTDEVNAEPVNKARLYLRKGVVDGVEIEDTLKINIDDIAAVVGAAADIDAIVAELKTGRYGMVAKDGTHPDIVAEVLGYDSGFALIHDLLTAEEATDKIKGVTDQRMLERYGDLIDTDSIKQAADEAIHDEAHIRFVATLGAALARLSKRPKIERAAVKAYAEDAISKLKLRDLRPDLYAAAAARAGREAHAAFIKGDVHAANDHNRAQQIQMALAKAAFDAKAEIVKAEALFKKVVTAKDTTTAKGRNMDIVQAARAILSAYGYDAAKNSPTEYMLNVAKYDEQTASDLAPYVDAALQDAPLSGDVRDVSVAVLRDLRETVAQLWYMSRRQQQIMIDGKKVDMSIAIDEILATLPTNGKFKSYGTTQTPQGALRFEKTLLGAAAIGFRAEALVGTLGEAASLNIIRPIQEAGTRARQAKLQLKEKLKTATQAVAPHITKHKIVMPSVAATNTTPAQDGYTFGDAQNGGIVYVIGALLHTGNASNLERLLLGGRGEKHPWGGVNEDGSLNTDRWDAFIAKCVADGHLRKEHFDYVQAVWDIYEELKPQMQRATRATQGRYFDEVEVKPIQTPFGTYAGGYAPARVDRTVGEPTHAQEIRDSRDAMPLRPATLSGMTKSRVKHDFKPLDLNPLAQSAYLDEAVTFAYITAPVQDAARLINSKRLRDAVGGINPHAVDKVLMPWLNRVAQQRVSTPVRGLASVDKIVGMINRRTATAAMFANVKNTLLNYTGLFAAKSFAKKGSMSLAFFDFIKNPKALTAAVGEASPYMADRLTNNSFDLEADTKALVYNPSPYTRAQEWTQRHTYVLQRALQVQLDVITWTAAYNHAVVSGLADPVFYADGAVRLSQGASNPEDVSNIESGSQIARFFTMFSSYFITQANAAVMQGTQADTVVQKAEVALSFWILPAILGAAMSVLTNGGAADDNDDGSVWDEWLGILSRETITYPTKAVPGLSQLVTAGVNRLDDKKFNDRLGVSPAFSMIEDAMNAPTDIYQALSGEGDWKKAVRETGTLLTLTTGLPFAPIAKPIGYAAGVAQGKIEPTSTLDAARGAITGVASPESKR